MHIVGQNTVVGWDFLNRETPILLSDFDVIVQRPDGTHANHYGSLYIDTPTDTQELSDSKIHYQFVPDVTGVWKITLSSGVSSAYYVESYHYLTVIEPSTSTRQKVSMATLSSDVADLFTSTSIEGV